MYGSSCCFTGHRKIPEAERSALHKRLYQTVKALLERDITTFYCGGALGFDTLAAQAVLKARRFHPQVKLILALPCRDQAEHWQEADRLLYESIEAACSSGIATWPTTATFAFATAQAVKAARRIRCGTHSAGAFQSSIWQMREGIKKSPDGVSGERQNMLHAAGFIL